MIKLLLIAGGGAVGAVLRYAVSGLAYRLLEPTFPWGTLAVNLIGSFVIGLLWAVSERIPFPPTVTTFIFIGVLGAFTTFSTFTLETFNLLRDGEVLLGLGNVLASNVLGLALVWMGFIVARAVLAGLH